MAIAANGVCDVAHLSAEHTSVFEAVIKKIGISALWEVSRNGILGVWVRQRNPSIILVRGQYLRMPRENSCSKFPR